MGGQKKPTISAMRKRMTREQRLANRLHIPVVRAFVQLEVRDGRGRLLRKRRQECHSWTRWLYNQVFTQAACVANNAADNLKMVKTDGTDLSNTNANIYTYCPGGTTYPAYGLKAPAGEDSYGIVVGTGTAGESFEDYALANKIANGTGAGQLAYIAAEDYVVSNAGIQPTVLRLVGEEYFDRGYVNRIRELAVSYTHLTLPTN